MRRPDHPFVTARRRAFTMTELLLAATVSAMTAAAAMSMVFAVSNATTQTRDVRTTSSVGNYTLGRLGTAIRKARGIGEVTASTVTLWVGDYNGDDKLNLYETAIIRYDASNKQILYDYMEIPAGGMPATTVSGLNFKSASGLGSKLTGADKRTVVWAEDIYGLTFQGYPSYTDTRVVTTAFKVGTGRDEMPFSITASPRAPADYIFASNALGNPLPGGTRKTRKSPSPWKGISQVTETTVTVGF